MSDTFETNPARLDEFRERLKYVEGATGVAVAVGKKVVALDLFDKPATCGRVWDRLLSGVVMDASEESRSDQVAAEVRRGKVDLAIEAHAPGSRPPPSALARSSGSIPTRQPTPRPWCSRTPCCTEVSSSRAEDQRMASATGFIEERGDPPGRYRGKAVVAGSRCASMDGRFPG